MKMYVISVQHYQQLIARITCNRSIWSTWSSNYCSRFVTPYTLANRLDCLLNRLFRRIAKKTSKLRVTGLCEGNPQGTVWWTKVKRYQKCLLPCIKFTHQLLFSEIKPRSVPPQRSGSMMTSSNGNISALLTICVGNSPVTGQFPAQKPVTRSFDVFFDLRIYERLSKQS